MKHVKPWFDNRYVRYRFGKTADSVRFRFGFCYFTDYIKSNLCEYRRIYHALYDPCDSVGCNVVLYFMLLLYCILVL